MIDTRERVIGFGHGIQVSIGSATDLHPLRRLLRVFRD